MAEKFNVGGFDRIDLIGQEPTVDIALFKSVADTATPYLVVSYTITITCMQSGA